MGIILKIIILLQNACVSNTNLDTLQLVLKQTVFVHPSQQLLANKIDISDMYSYIHLFHRYSQKFSFVNFPYLIDVLTTMHVN